MTGNIPIASVIIPTHNRKALLWQTLDALCTQTYPLESIEVLVVADGCSDGTVEMLRHYRAPFSLRIIEQTNQGPATARNYGAAGARGRLLIFLDDDIEAAPHLIEAHVRAHQHQPGLVVIGYLPPCLQTQTGFFRLVLWTWWEAMFDVMRQPGHRYTYSDVLGGNFSLEAELFGRIGGFNPAFWCHEDYELGVRLLQAGATFTFAADALGYHREASDIDRSLQRKYQEGRADVLMGRCHPELRPTLLMARLEAYSLLPSRILRTFAFKWPVVGDKLAARLRRTLDLLEQARLYHFWQRLLDGLLGYWYWRGVAVELGALRALADFLQENPVYSNEIGTEIVLDLCEGLEVAERRLDNERPLGACVCYGSQLVGYIRRQPGAERLRGIHLRPTLATRLAAPLLKAMALEGATDLPAGSDWLLAACDDVLKQGWRCEVDCA
jgi:GT2 family glycosyltransferase